MVVVADCHPHRLAPWRLGDGTVWKHLGSEGTEPGQLNEPSAVAVTRAGILVVTDQHHSLCRFLLYIEAGRCRCVA